DPRVRAPARRTCGRARRRRRDVHCRLATAHAGSRRRRRAPVAVRHCSASRCKSQPSDTQTGAPLRAPCRRGSSRRCRAVLERGCGGAFARLRSTDRELLAQTASAATALRKVASVARTHRTLVAAPGQFVYTKSAEMFVVVGDSLRQTNASAPQRAALYAVAARIPGVELVGEVTDAVGRSGVEVAMDDDATHVRSTLIFDPQTSLLLAEEQFTLAGNSFGYPSGTCIETATYLKTAIVDTLGARP